MMNRVTADLGKCPVCGVATVEWTDEEAGVPDKGAPALSGCIIIENYYN
jgi:hypothetical protein